MPTVRLVPSTVYNAAGTTYLTIANQDNMLTNTDSTNYGTATNINASTSNRYFYLRGFNFSSIPSNARVDSFTVKLKASETGASTSTSYRPRICNGTTTLTGSSSTIGTSVSTISFTGVTTAWDTIKGYGSNFGIRINARRASSNTQSVINVYGAEIEVEYSLPATITSTLTGNGTIDPSGATSLYSGEQYTLTITPTNSNDTVTATNNGTDVTSSLVRHTSVDLVQTASSFTTEINGSGGAFYTSSSTTGNNFSYAVGTTAENPSHTTASTTYVKDNGSNTATGYAIYSFDFSGIPSGATINSVSVKCYGFTESTTHDSTHKANITLWSGSTQKGTEQYFTSTSNQTITLSNVGTWTRSELQSAKLRFEVAYYGGGIFGITWAVNYESDGVTYTYTYTVSGDATIAVTISGSGETSKLYVKLNGTWTEVQTAYKKINGSWIEQSDITTLFNSSTNYKKGN